MAKKQRNGLKEWTVVFTVGKLFKAIEVKAPHLLYAAALAVETVALDAGVAAAEVGIVGVIPGYHPVLLSRVGIERGDCVLTVAAEHGYISQIDERNLQSVQPANRQIN